MKKINKYIIISIPYSIYFLLTYIDSLWFFFGERDVYRVILLIGLLVHTFYLLKFDRIMNLKFYNSRIIGILLSFFAVLGFVLFPIQNLNLGDGILLVENALLENMAFGYTVIPDEILEGLIHSIVFLALKSYISNPMISYQIVSTLIGAIFLIVIYLKFKNESSYPLIIILFLSQGGSLLFYGYTENYSIVSLLIFITILYGFNKIQNEEFSTKSIIIISILAAFSAITHLISGFMVLGLIYFCILVSSSGRSIGNILNNKNFYKNTILALITAFLVMVPIYCYFIFFSELRIEIGLAHAVHPPFLSLKKIFSVNHLRDLILEAFFMILPLAFTLKYIYLTEKNIITTIIQKKEFQFTLLVFAGFFIHFLTYNPLLGYPADWDLMGFIWIPMFIFVVHLAREHSLPFLENIPFYVTLYVILLFNANSLKITEIQSNQVKFLEESIREYLQVDYRNRESNIESRYKKSYIHTGYFLFRTHRKIKEAGDRELLEINESLQNEFRGGEILNDREKWKKFLSNATEFHHKYLERIEKKDK